MARKLVFIFLFSITSSWCFSSETGFVFSDNLRIRNSPSINGSVISSISRKKITIYDKQGTKRMRNGVWDYWYKISEAENHWVNAYYVATFPIFFRYDLTANGKAYKIIGIDDYGIVHYYITSGTRGVIEQRDTELFNRLIDSKYIRVSELVNEINRQLNINEDTEAYILEQYKEECDISSLVLFYGLNTYTDISSVFEILGDPPMGTGHSAIWLLYDLNKAYEIRFYLSGKVTYLLHSW